MNLILKLFSSLWFWADILLSVSGGVIVYWGLRVEKKAERKMPPADFNPDIFDDVVESQKSELERGWRILMTGIVVEVVAALSVSVISSLEIAESNERAQIAQREASQANERAARFDADRVRIEKQAEEIRSTNFVLQARVLELENKTGRRKLTDDQIRIITKFLEATPRGKVLFDWVADDEEVTLYKTQLADLFKRLGYGLEDRRQWMSTSSPIVGLRIGIMDTNSPPPHAVFIQKAFASAGIELPGFIDDPSGIPAGISSEPNTPPDKGAVVIAVGKKPVS